MNTPGSGRACERPAWWRAELLEQQLGVLQGLVVAAHATLSWDGQIGSTGRRLPPLMHIRLQSNTLS